MSKVNYDKYFDLVAARDLPTFSKGLLSFAEDLGFPLCNVLAAHGVDRPTEPKVGKWANQPPGWDASLCDPENIRRDPVNQRMKRTQVPFAFDQDFYVRSGAGDMWEETAAFGYHTGIAAVLHLPHGRVFVVGCDRAGPLPRDPNRLMRLLADLQLLTTFVVDRGFDLLLPEVRRKETDLYLLSRRELEVLRWASAGKTAWETGNILSISEHTVNKYVAAAAAKLGCVGKAQTIARAFQQGLLQ
jgi:DNA-binding CsgD family transcriptional regulator